MKMSEKRRDIYASALAIFIGVGTAVIAQNYKIGTLTQMGPGYFPAALGALLAFVGVIIGVTALGGRTVVAAGPDLHHGFADKFDWRGWTCIVGSVLAFIVLAEYAGLLLATFFCVFLACWGDKTAQLQTSATLALGITVFGILLFSNLLHVQLPPYYANVFGILISLLGIFVFCYALYQQNVAVFDIFASIIIIILATGCFFVVYFASGFVIQAAQGQSLHIVQFPTFQTLLLSTGVGVISFRLLFIALSARLSGIRASLLVASIAVFGVLLFSYTLAMQLYNFRGN